MGFCYLIVKGYHLVLLSFRVKLLLIYQKQKAMKTKQDITREFIGRTDCAAYVIALHEAGFYEDVLRNILKTSKNTTTYDILITKLCYRDGVDLTDYNGAPIGTEVTVRYMGAIVDKHTNYSLFQY